MCANAVTAAPTQLACVDTTVLAQDASMPLLRQPSSWLRGITGLAKDRREDVKGWGLRGWEKCWPGEGSLGHIQALVSGLSGPDLGYMACLDLYLLNSRHRSE